MFNWLALAFLALRVWGWSGMVPSVTSADLGFGVAAYSVPDDSHYLTCPIVVNSAFPFTEAQAWHTILHEVGHCVGYYGFPWGNHSTDPRSVMYATLTDSDQILPEDFAAVHTNLMMRLHWHTTVPMVGRMAYD